MRSTSCLSWLSRWLSVRPRMPPPTTATFMGRSRAGPSWSRDDLGLRAERGAVPQVVAAAALAAQIARRLRRAHLLEIGGLELGPLQIARLEAARLEQRVAADAEPPGGTRRVAD